MTVDEARSLLVSSSGASAAVLVALLALLAVVVARCRPRRGATGAAHTEEQRRAQRISSARARANAVTYVIASIATAASLVGMWPVTRAAVIAAGIPAELVTPVALTVLGLLEGTIVVCGIRARANVLESGETGVDGVGLWVAVGASSVISATEAALAAPSGTPGGQQFVTVLVRLAAPIVAGWLWERGLAPERRAARGERPGILATYLTRLRTNLLSWAGDADADEISRRRAAARASRLSEKLRGTNENALTRRQRWVLRRLRKALRASRAAHSAEDRRYLLEDIAASQHALALAQVETPSPWDRHPPSPGTVESDDPFERPAPAAAPVGQGMPTARSMDEHFEDACVILGASRHEVAAHAARAERGVTVKVPESPEKKRPEKKRVAAPPEKPSPDPEGGELGPFFRTGSEADAEELKKVRRLFKETIQRTGEPPSVNAVRKAIGRSWQKSKPLHTQVLAEFTPRTGQDQDPGAFSASPPTSPTA
jgi:hypothetical protein